MSKLTFRGGIHTFEGKELTSDKHTKVYLPASGELVFPLSQHIGAPAEPCVNIGDRVLVGQVIAKAKSVVSSNIISSASGTVKAIEERKTVTGQMIKSIIISNDGEYKTAPWVGETRNLEELSREDILSATKDAGIVGLGGAGFPTHVKLSPKEPEKIEYFIINASECEPYLTSDYRAMLEKGEKLIEGIEVILRLFPNARCIVAIEDNKPEAISHMTELAKGHEKISVMVMKTKYPQGAERSLIYAVTGRKINSKMLPSDAGCIVNNVSTVIAVGDAVLRSMPLTKKTVTVTGDAVADPCNIEVPIGTSFSEVLTFAGGCKKEPVKIISGGPMMGIALKSLDVPIVKTSSSILCLTEQEAICFEPTGCINCGRCMDVCPENLMPMILLTYAEKENYEKFIKNYGMECVECGCCSYVCPGRNRLTENFKTMKVKTRNYIKSNGGAR